MQADSTGVWSFKANADSLFDTLATLQKKSIIFPHEHDYLKAKISDFIDTASPTLPHLIEGVNKNIILLEDEDGYEIVVNRTEETLDPITLLPTRVALTRQLDKWISEDVESNQNKIVALFILELDDFSMINDALDHAIGDFLLFQIARRLEQFDLYPFKLSRLHGDEFGLAVTGLRDVEACWDIANWIVSSFKQAFETHKESLYITPSIGFSVYPHVTDDNAGLMRTAYVALNKSKLDETQQTYFYDAKYGEGLYQDLVIESELNEAINSKVGLVTYFQPKQTLSNGKIEGLEALVRWEHPTKGLVSPGKFIPVAERSGLICGITNIVIEQVCAHLPKLRKAGFTAPVSINISARDFARKQFVQDVCAILASYKVSSRDIELEITESAFISDFNHCCIILNALREEGFQLSIDDFGTGYSSLSYLRKLPVDVLKIDMSFVRDIERSDSVFKTYSALIQIADALNLKVVAEGVDNPEQVKKLRAIQCDMIQGYHLTKPLPIDGICEYLLKAS